MQQTICECIDPNCPCDGKCQLDAKTLLYRVDMEDVTGTHMCELCAEDALSSGVFSTDAPIDESDHADGYHITDCGYLGSQYRVTQDGRHIGDYSEFSDVIDAIRDDMEVCQYWPGVFYTNDHGNTEVVNITK